MSLAGAVFGTIGECAMRSRASPRARMAAISQRRCSGVMRSGGVWLTSCIGCRSFLSNLLDAKLSWRTATNTMREFRAPACWGGVLPKQLLSQAGKCWARTVFMSWLPAGAKASISLIRAFTFWASAPAVDVACITAE